MANRAKQRSKRYIDPEVQGALARRMVLHWFLYAAVASLLLVTMRSLVNPETPVVEHVYELWQTYSPLLVVLLSMLPMLVYDAVKLSNRFAGPVLRLRRAIGALAEGRRPETIRLRDNDFLKDVAEDMNRVVERYGPAEAAAEPSAEPDS